MKLRFTKYFTTEEAARAFLAAEKAKHRCRYYLDEICRS